VTFLMFDAWGGGGVARTTVNLANELCRTHDVRVISLRRRRRTPRFELDPRIAVTTLMDARDGVGSSSGILDRLPSRLRPRVSEASMSLRTDLLLRRAVRQVGSGLLVSTRPSLHLAATTWARPGVTTVGWDHLNFPTRWQNPLQQQVLRHTVPRLDAYVVLTEADRRDYLAELPGITTEIRVIRNSVSWPLAEHPPDLDSRVVVAAGRLVSRKGFPRLVRAFAPVARAHPDWQLHIYGSGQGTEVVRIETLLDELDLRRQVLVQGYHQDLPTVFSEASVYAMGSRSEGFPMVLIEAMSVGLPLIAFDCPRGPGETIDDGVNGFLVDDDDIAGYSRALARLVEDADLRRRLGARARQDAERYVVGSIAADWVTLFADLARGSAPAAR